VASGCSGPARHRPKKSSKPAEDGSARAPGPRVDQRSGTGQAPSCRLAAACAPEGEALPGDVSMSLKMASQLISSGTDLAGGATAGDGACLAAAATACDATGETSALAANGTEDDGVGAAAAARALEEEEASEGGAFGAHASCSYFFLQSSTRSSLEAVGPGLAAPQSPPYLASAAAFPRRCIWAISSGPQR